MSKKYIIVNIINSVKTPSEFSSKNWPLHLTLLPHFNVSNSEKELVEELRACLGKYESFELSAIGEELFGKNEDIPVITLSKNKMLMNLHTNLMEIVSSLGGLYDDSSYIGKGYRPHVTTLKGIKLDSTQQLVVDTVTLAEVVKLPEGKLVKIVETFSLKPLD